MARPQQSMDVPPGTIFPVEVDPPFGFDPEDLNTWPPNGRYEYVDGRLLYMPPCGDDQGDCAFATVGFLWSWMQSHPDFVGRTNEIGVSWPDGKRGIDVAVWRRNDLGPNTGGFVRVPPLLAVEIAGELDRESYLVDKAHWYLARSVAIVWLVLPETREVVVLADDAERRYGIGETLAAHPALPGLAPTVADFFRQLG